jgi:hypothetical protein
MVEVDDYGGPKFPGTNYIPIFPVTRRFEYKKSDCSRTKFPLRLAYAITVHKAQGLTLKQVVLNLERKDVALPVALIRDGIPAQRPGVYMRLGLLFGRNEEKPDENRGECH